MSKKKKDEEPSRVIAQNRKAWHDYFIEDKYEALFKYGDRLPDFEFG